MSVQPSNPNNPIVFFDITIGGQVSRPEINTDFAFWGSVELALHLTSVTEIIPRFGLKNSLNGSGILSDPLIYI